MIEYDINALSDDCFVRITDSIYELCTNIEGELGEKISLEEFSEFLLVGLKSLNVNVFRDCDITEISKVTIKKIKNKSKKPIPGDIVAIPITDTQSALGVFITTNRFGNAYGFFRGLHRIKSEYVKTDLEALGKPCYSSIDPILKGRWKIVGHDETLLEFFPSDPEIYHYYSQYLVEACEFKLGEFGAAESSNGVLRNVSEKEAFDVGLLNHEYELIRLEEEMVDFLKNKLV